jgi:hypothetical protein
MKPNESLASNDAGPLRTMHWKVSLAARGQAPNSRTAFAKLCRPYADSQASDQEIHALCEALIASKGQLGP